MEAIEFSAVVKDGRIEIPEEYRGQVSDTVRVVLRPDPAPTGEDLIARLLKYPLKAKAFTPIRRDELYGRE